MKPSRIKTLEQRTVYEHGRTENVEGCAISLLVAAVVGLIGYGIYDSFRVRPQFFDVLRQEDRGTKIPKFPLY